VTLREEIFQQPDVLRGLLASQSAVIDEAAAWLRRQAPSYLYIAGRGTSHHVALYAGYLWGIVNRLPVAMAAPSIFGPYASPPLLEHGAVVGISQSGQSPDIVGVLTEARRQQRPTLAIVNDTTSPLARAADAVLDIRAGNEQEVAATKTYTASLMAVAMLSAALSDDARARDQLAAVPDLVEQALLLEDAVIAAAERMSALERCVVVGRGYNYATTHECSLKLKELAYVVAERYSAADFRHGPIAMVARDFPVVAVAVRGPVCADLTSLLDRLRNDLGAELMVISNDSAALAHATHPLQLPADLPEWLNPIVTAIPCQLFAFHLTRAKGIDPHAPRGLQKVTRTE